MNGLKFLLSLNDLVRHIHPPLEMNNKKAIWGARRGEIPLEMICSDSRGIRNAFLLRVLKATARLSLNNTRLP